MTYLAPIRYLLGVALALVVFVGSAVSADEVIFENAEDGTAKRWIVFDDRPGGASIDVTFDRELASNVIRTTGSGLDNGFRTGGISRGGWDETARFHLSFKLKSEEPFIVFVAVQTDAGFRFLQYNPIPEDDGRTDGRNIRHGLGSHVRDGSWRTIERDLAEDVTSVEPGNRLVSVHGFLVRGSVSLDDVSLAPALSDGRENQPPIAVAGPDMDGVLGQTLRLIGSDSSDPDGTITDFDWSLDGTSIGDGAVVDWTPMDVGQAQVTTGTGDHDVRKRRRGLLGRLSHLWRPLGARYDHLVHRRRHGAHLHEPGCRLSAHVCVAEPRRRWEFRQRVGTPVGKLAGRLCGGLCPGLPRG